LKKQVIITLLVILNLVALLALGLLYFFVYDLRFALNVNAIISGLPVVAGIAGVITLVFLLIKRKQLRFGAFGIAIAVILMPYLVIFMYQFPTLVLPNPVNKHYIDSEQNRLMALVLKDMSKAGQGYNFVNPMTSSELESYNSEIAANLKHDINRDNQAFHWANYDFSKLIDQLIEANSQSVPLTIKSSLKDGYYIDYYDINYKWAANLFEFNEKDPFLDKQASKWDIYHQVNNWLADYYRERHPDPGIISIWPRYVFNTFHPNVSQTNVKISRPAYDPETGYMLIVYEGGSIGLIVIYKYENGSLIYIGSHTIWMV